MIDKDKVADALISLKDFKPLRSYARMSNSISLGTEGVINADPSLFEHLANKRIDNIRALGPDELAAIAVHFCVTCLEDVMRTAVRSGSTADPQKIVFISTKIKLFLEGSAGYCASEWVMGQIETSLLMVVENDEELTHDLLARLRHLLKKIVRRVQIQAS